MNLHRGGGYFVAVIIQQDAKIYSLFVSVDRSKSRSQWPRGLSRRSAAARLLRSWVRIPPGAWIFVCCECCVLSGRGLCDELINRPEESYRLWSVVVCDQETSRMRRPWPALGRSATKTKTALNVSGGISTHHQELISLYLQYLALLRPLLRNCIQELPEK